MSETCAGFHVAGAPDSYFDIYALTTLSPSAYSPTTHGDNHE
ncbi:MULTISPECIES: hypothetical protein [unclassified Halomonas]|nr:MULTISPECIES: hypothetical protein [unclassified Halomonas]